MLYKVTYRKKRVVEINWLSLKSYPHDLPEVVERIHAIALDEVRNSKRCQIRLSDGTWINRAQTKFIRFIPLNPIIRLIFTN
jgi:hypothetical protein